MAFIVEQGRAASDACNEQRSLVEYESSVLEIMQIEASLNLSLIT